MRVQNVTPWVQVRYSMFFSIPVCRYPIPTRASVTVSPSSSRIRRNTPWVDGCCGPLLTTIRSCPAVTASTTSSQSCPVTLMTGPSASSPAAAKGSSVAPARPLWLCSCSEPPPGAVNRTSSVMASRSSRVGPAMVRRRDGRPLVLDGDAAERVVLTLRVPGPVVRHLDAGQGWVIVEDDAEEVVGLALVPVVGRPDMGHRRHVWIVVRADHLETHAAVVRHGQQREARVQLTAGLPRVVHAADALADLVPQAGIVAEDASDSLQVLASDEEGQLATIGDHLLDRLVEHDPRLFQGRRGGLADGFELVRPGVRGRAQPNRVGLADLQPPVARGVTGAVSAEHAFAGRVLRRQARLLRHRSRGVPLWLVHRGLPSGIPSGRGLLVAGVGGNVGPLLGRRPRRLGGVRIDLAFLPLLDVVGAPPTLPILFRVVAQRSRPFISWVAGAFTAACSCSFSIASRWAPSGSCWICSCNLMIESISISGRGGQPGR